MAGRMYSGKKPLLADGWIFKCELVDDIGQKWIVFAKNQIHSSTWVTYKVVADGKALNKANYWVVKNLYSGKLAFCYDMATMREKRKFLYDQFEKFLDTECI